MRRVPDHPDVVCRGDRYSECTVDHIRWWGRCSNEAPLCAVPVFDECLEQETKNEWKQTDTRGNEEACHMKIFQILPFTTYR
jgi:hypothetical protein